MTGAPQQFTKKPVAVEAMRWDGSEKSQAQIVTWSEGAVSGWFDNQYHLQVATLEGPLRADVGDWIIKGVQGEFYPCKPDIFEMTHKASAADTTTEAFLARARNAATLPHVALHLTEHVEAVLDQEHHEQLCACTGGPGNCATYGATIPWTYSHHDVIRVVIELLEKESHA